MVITRHVQPRALGALLLCLVLAGLAVLVVSRDRRAQLNTLFALFITTVIGWITSITLALTSPTPRETVLLGRWAFAFASAMSFALLCMFSAFPTALTPLQIRRLLIPGLACAASIAASLSPWVVTGATAGRHGTNLVYGPLHSFVGIYTVLCLVAAVHALWRKTRAATGIAKLQLRYLLLGVFLGGFGIVTTNLLIPFLWKTSRFSVLGPYFTLVFASFSAHAIIRHRLMDIRVFVRRGAVYASAVALTSLLVLATATTASVLIGQDTSHLPLPTVLAIALLFAIVFEPLRRWLNDSFNRYLYREPYDYRSTIRQVSRRLSTTLHLGTLLSYLTEVLDHTIKPETFALYLREPASHRFHITFLRNSAPTSRSRPFLDSSSSLIRYLEHDHLSLLATDFRFNPRSPEASAAHEELTSHGAQLAFPLLHDRHLSGLLLLGPKRSGDPYFPEDIDLLTTLVSQAAVAIKNAQLYSEVVLANEYIQNILSTMESGVIAVAATGTVTLFNAASARMTQLPQHHVKGKAFDVLPAPLAGVLADTLGDGQPRSNIELSLRGHVSRGGTPVICSTSILRTEAATPVGAVAVFSDLTTIKQLEADKRRVERLASVGALAAGIAHEIKNPMVAIKTFAELLPERFADDEFRDNFSRVAIREIDRIDSLVARLRGLAAPASPRLVPIDIREPIEETLSLLHARLDQAHVAIKRDYSGDLPLIVGDHDQIKQLFLNLLLNSIEAIGSHGEVTIRTHLTDSPNPRTLIVEITDTGTGIPDSIVGNVFDPFVTSKPHGSGLGLSICRGIADAHRATIRVHNNPNNSGATAIVEFMVTEERASNVVHE